MLTKMKLFLRMRKTREAYVENVEQYEIHKGGKEYGAYASKGYTFDCQSLLSPRLQPTLMCAWGCTARRAAALSLRAERLMASETGPTRPMNIVSIVTTRARGSSTASHPLKAPRCRRQTQLQTRCSPRSAPARYCRTASWRQRSQRTERASGW